MEDLSISQTRITSPSHPILAAPGFLLSVQLVVPVEASVGFGSVTGALGSTSSLLSPLALIPWLVPVRLAFRGLIALAF